MAASAPASAAASSAVTTILITGANRGIGLGLVQLYAAQPHVRVIGTTRDVKNAAELQALAKANKNVSLVTVDVSDSKSVATLPAQLQALQPPVAALDVLINNAGVLSGVKGHDGFGPLQSETVDNWLSVYRTNVVGAWDVTNQVLPLIRKSKAPKIVHVSSLMGQFAFTLDGPIPGLSVAYRASKSAMNQLAAVQSREYNAPHVAAAAAPADAKLQAAAAAASPVVTVLTLHPGVVDTPIFEQTAAKVPGMLPVSQSASGIAKLIANAKVDPKATFHDAITQQQLTW